MGELFRMRAERGSTLILVTHDHELAARCDRMVHIADGRIVGARRGLSPLTATPSSAGTAWRIARRELRGGVRGFRVFLACLMLGVATTAAVGSLGEALKAGLARDAKMILGGDVELVQFSQPLADRRDGLPGREHHRHLPRRHHARDGPYWRTASSRSLVELKAVDGAYPLVDQARVWKAARRSRTRWPMAAPRSRRACSTGLRSGSATGCGSAGRCSRCAPCSRASPTSSLRGSRSAPA